MKNWHYATPEQNGMTNARPVTPIDTPTRDYILRIVSQVRLSFRFKGVLIGKVIRYHDKVLCVVRCVTTLLSTYCRRKWKNCHEWFQKEEKALTFIKPLSQNLPGGSRESYKYPLNINPPV